MGILQQTLSLCMKQPQIKYTPFQSFVELSFFTELARRKLTEYKLDDGPKEIHGFMTAPARLTKFNTKPTVNLDGGSFDAGDKLNIDLPGTLYNFNTIEEFKLADKLSLLKQWGVSLRQGMHKGVFTSLHMLTFCDLKKHKFYYWLAFPTLHSLWSVLSKSNNNEYELQIEEHLREHRDSFFQIVDDEMVSLAKLSLASEGTFVFVDSCLSADGTPLIQVKNYLFYLATKGFSTINLLVYRNNGLSYSVKLALDSFDPTEEPKVTGWERTAQGKLGPKLADLGALIDPHQLASQAVDLNLELMKWRVAPELNLDVIKTQRVLLLGAGTLGSYVARALMGWGVRHITFVDSGRVSYLNPVRQPLYSFADCFSDHNQGAFKAQRAAEALKEIFPGVQSLGHSLEVPMVGHPSKGNETRENYEQLVRLYAEHDAVFLLMDSRESRWLPTLMGVQMNKPVVNAALGFDSYLVMRHSTLDCAQRLGCYFCNDVFAPKDLLSDRTLDQMCTVTRPGGALVALSLAVELFVSMLQHEDKHHAAAGAQSKFGAVPHQIRGFLGLFSQSQLQMPAYEHCSACGSAVVEEYAKNGWAFVEECLKSTSYLERVSGLESVQQQAEEAIDDIESIESFID